jgi:hypothetical protein
MEIARKSIFLIKILVSQQTTNKTEFRDRIDAMNRIYKRSAFRLYLEQSPELVVYSKKAQTHTKPHISKQVDTASKSRDSPLFCASLLDVIRRIAKVKKCIATMLF